MKSIYNYFDSALSCELACYGTILLMTCTTVSDYIFLDENLSVFKSTTIKHSTWDDDVCGVEDEA